MNFLTERTRTRTFSESSDGGDNKSGGSGVGYDIDGKFSFTSVNKSKNVSIPKTTVDENGKFSYYSSDMRPVPPGSYIFAIL